MVSMRFRGRSLTELKERGRQGAHIVAERLGLSHLNRLPGDAEMLRLFEEVANINSPQDLFDYFRDRATYSFYRSFESEERTVDTLKLGFPDHVSAVIARANRTCDGRFDLLGYRDLRFGDTVPDWHFDPISNQYAPRVHWSRINEVVATETGDKKIIWELNRHQYFTSLGQAYWLMGDERYAEQFTRQLESWCMQNPPKIGVNWLSSLELAYRCISWIWAFQFFKRSPKFNSAVFLQMLKYLYLQGLHIETYLSTYFSPNTHLTGEALGLYMLGSFLQELDDGRRWKKIGSEVMLKALDFQVRPDGTYCEQATHYLRYTTDLYCNLLLLRILNGEADNGKIKASLNRLFDCMLHSSYPDGESPNIGDEDGGRLYFLDDVPISDLRPAFALGAALLERSDLKHIAEDRTCELLWLLGPDGLNAYENIPTREPDHLAMCFRDGGLCTARSDWTDSADSIVIDCGPHGFLNGGHAHADALSFVLAVEGKPVLVDSGTYNYTTEKEERDRFRSTSSHNCLTVNGESSSIPAGPFSWSTTATSRLIEWAQDPTGVRFTGSHDGFLRLGVDYQRSIEFWPGSALEIEESIKCATPNRYEVNFILSPEFSAEIIKEPYIVQITDRVGKPALTAKGAVVGDARGPAVWQLVPWEVSLQYGAKVPTVKMVLVVEGEGNLIVRTAISWANRSEA